MRINKKEVWVYTYYYCFRTEANKNKRQDCKRNLYMEQYISTRRAASNKVLESKSPFVNDYALKLGGALYRRLNIDKPYCHHPVTGSGLACQLCKWDSG